MCAVVLVKKLGSLPDVSMLSLVGPELGEAWRTLMTIGGTSATADFANHAVAARAVEMIPVVFMLNMRTNNMVKSRGLRRTMDRDG